MSRFWSHPKQQMAFVQGRPAGRRYNGLKNQGATCYLNSVLQCFYMTQDVRKEVEDFAPDPQIYNEESTDLMLELQKLFKKLQEGDGTTEGITRSLCITNVYEQEDVVEYYQKILKAIGPQVSKLFEGKMSNKTKCVNDHIFEEKCHFFTIPLAIETGHSEVFKVIKGLQTFFSSVKLDENNWLYCECCGQKTESETWNEIEKFPTILTLYPKRFYFDHNQMRPVKNHCPMDIPLQMNIHDNKYELYAVINHIGNEIVGHHDAVIKSFENDEWYCFDDSVVTKDSKSSFQHSRLACLLMYRKVDGLHPEKKSTNDLQLRWQEYYKLVTTLLESIRHYTSVFEESKFPTNYKDTEILCYQFLEFKKTKLPEIEDDKNHSEHIYKAFKGAVQPGQINVTPSHHPISVEKEWCQLQEALIKRERLLRNKFEQVYRFHQHLVKRCSDYSVPLTQPELDEVMLCYIQDLLAWVEKKQRLIQRHTDLPSIEPHVGRYHRLHQSIIDFKFNIHHAQADKNQLTPASKQEYIDYLAELDLQYNKLLDLRWDLEQGEKKVNTVQATGGKLLREGHPVQNTTETLEHHMVMKNLKQHNQTFMRNSLESESRLYGADEHMQAESTYNNTTQCYNNLPQTMEEEEQSEAVYKSYIPQFKDLRLRLERYESHIISCFSQPVDTEPMKAFTQETTEQETMLEDIKKDLDAVVKQSEAALASSQESTWACILRSEIDFTTKAMEHVYCLFSLYLDKVKRIDLKIHSAQGTGDVLRQDGNELCDQALLKVPDKPMEAEHCDPIVVNELGVESESKGHHNVRFEAVQKKVQEHLQEFDKQMQVYRQCYDWLTQWIADSKQRQEMIQAKPIIDNKALKEQLAQGKNLLEEIKNKEIKVKECVNYAIACITTIKKQEAQYSVDSE